MDRRVDVVITVRASVPTVALKGLFDRAINLAPEDGILSFEVDGTNPENRSRA